MHLVHIVPSGEWGGAERYAFDICRHYLGAGWTVKVMTREALAVDCHFRKAGIDIIHAPLRSYPDYYSARALARAFEEIPKGEGIVHAHRYNDALTCIIARKIARRPDIRLVCTRHKASRGHDGLLRRIVYKGIDSHLFVSQLSKETFYSRWKPGKAPLAEEKTAVAYNSLLQSCATPLPEPEKGPIVAAYRGGLKPGKGIETLIDAFALLPNHRIRLHIMGKGHPDYVDGLRRRAQMAGVAPRIAWVTHSEFAEEKMAAVHFGVLPAEQPEAFGMANLEFMACGKPQISTCRGALREVLTPGEDTVEVEAGDAGQLAEAINLLAGDRELRQTMGAKALDNYRRRFAWPLFIERLTAQYMGGRES